MSDKPNFSGTVVIEENAACSEDVYRMRLSSPEIGGKADPGQFVMVKSSGPQSEDPLIPRPFSIHQADSEGFAILYKVVGRGTALLSKLQAGVAIPVYGPLGSGFTVGSGKTHIVVGGGIGVAPLLFLAERIKTVQPDAEVHIIIGAASCSDIVEENRFKAVEPVSFRLATEDGSKGVKGLVTDVLADYGEMEGEVTVYSCGPVPMLHAVSRWSRERKFLCQVSTETVMACGVGACLGCAIEGSGLNRNDRYLHVCTDGPVFNSNELWL